MIKILFWIIIFCGMTVFMHELGHYLYFQWVLKKDVELRYVSNIGFLVGHPKDYKGLTAFQQYGVYWAGIFSGLIVIAFAAYYINIIFFAISLPIYLWGCKSDFKNMWKALKS